MEILCSKSWQRVVESLVGQKVMSKGDDRITVQSSKDFADAAMQL